MPQLFRNPHLWLFVAIYAASLTVLALGHRDVGDTLPVLGIFGIGLPLIARLACLGYPRPSAPAPARRGEWRFVLALLLFIVAFLAFKAPLLGLCLAQGADPRLHDAVNTALKLLAFVAIPGLLIRWYYGGWPGVGAPKLAPWRAGLVFVIVGAMAAGVQLVIGSGARALFPALHTQHHWLLALMLCWLWMSLEAGLVEEFFFRWWLQSRLAAISGSQVSAIFLSAIAFGLAHAPGFWLRGSGAGEGLGDHPDLLTSVAYSLCMQSIVGLLFGVLWARTRNLPLLIALHGLVDAVANAADFMETWKL